jgi:hypothetical protein
MPKKNKFPKAEGEIIALAQTMIAGFTANVGTYPAPSVAVTELTTLLNTFQTERNDTVAAEAAYRQAVDAKDAALEELVEAMKKDIAYAELVTDNNDALLKEIGWSGRAEPTKLQPPGQCTAFEIIGQGDGWVRFDWKEPRKEGGKVTAYTVQRSEDGQNFADAATAIESEAVLVDQPKGKKLIYQVVAVNRAGAGLPSNIVSLIL